MPPRPTRTALRDRYDRRQAEVTLDAARVFAAKGYDQTSVPQLAGELGLAAGSLYHYFGGKEQLLIAICNELMEPLLARVADLESEALEPADHLRALVRIWVRHVVEHRDHMLVFQQERHVIDHGDQWRQVRADRKRFETLADAALAAIQTTGAARFTDRRLALSALLGMVNHTAQWFRPRGRLSPEQIADGYVDLLLAG
jgi:TetR/AcrR family transcriptional regulator, cholesterol catabolism regulator